MKPLTKTEISNIDALLQTESEILGKPKKDTKDYMYHTDFINHEETQETLEESLESLLGLECFQPFYYNEEDYREAMAILRGDNEPQITPKERLWNSLTTY